MSASVPLPNSTTTAAGGGVTAHPWAAPPPPTPDTLRVELAQDAHQSLSAIESFFTHFLAHVLVAVLVLIVLGVLGYLSVRVFGLLLRGCGVHEHARRQAEFVGAVLVVYVAASGALGAVGIDFQYVASTLGIFSLVVTYGFGSFFANLIGGFTLQSRGAYEIGRVLSIDTGGGQTRTGQIRELTLTHVIIEPIQRVPHVNGMVQHRSAIPNRLFADMVCDELYAPPQSSSSHAKATSSPVSVAVAAAAAKYQQRSASSSYPPLANASSVGGGGGVPTIRHSTLHHTRAAPVSATSGAGANDNHDVEAAAAAASRVRSLTLDQFSKHGQF